MEKGQGSSRKETGEKIGEMRKWEYLFVKMISNGHVYRPSTLNFKDIKDNKIDLADFSN